MQRSLKHKIAGFSLLELMVAVLVLSLGTLAATRATDQSRLAIGGADTRILAEIVAANRAEELRIFGSKQVSLPRNVTMGNQSFFVDTVQESTAGGMLRVQITARAQSGPGAVFVTYLPTQTGGQP